MVARPDNAAAAQRERERIRRQHGQTVCPNGHDLTLPRALTGRQCRACHRDKVRSRYQEKTKVVTSDARIVRERLLAIDGELLRLIDDQMHADGVRGREIKARILELRTEKDTLSAQRRKLTGEHE